jgi:hypothetical protein
MTMNQWRRSLGQRPGFATRALTIVLLLGSLTVGTGTGRSEDRTLAAATPGLTVAALRPARERYAAPDVREVPDFRRHLLPLLGRLGCNGRACHGSFQGQGGFRLSLFGYDLKADLEALTRDDSGRVDLKAPEVSKILEKPTLAIPHKGGKRMDAEGWQYRMIYRWVEAGARESDGPARLERLDIAPSEVVFGADGEAIPLRVVAHWSDGSSEDVTCLSRFRTNDESIAEVDADGVVSSLGRGDTHIVAFYDRGVAVAQVMRPVSDAAGPDYPDVPTPTKVDALIVAKLRKLAIVPSEVCSDSEFLRRVSLDMTGTLPTPREIDAFVADASSAKRVNKVDELLARPAYAARWTTKLCDITGNSPRHFEGEAPAQEYARHFYEWIARRIAQNVPYDELIAGIVLGRSRRPGQTYTEYIEEQSAFYRAKDPVDFTARETLPYYWAKHNTRLPEERALNFSYAFLGVRIECAQCHKHPFDRWTQDDFRRFTAFFDRIGFGVAPDDRKAFQAMMKTFENPALNRSQRERARLQRAQNGEVVPWQEVYLAPVGTRVEGRNVVKVSVPDQVAPRVLGGDEIDPSGFADPRVPLWDWMRSKDNPYFARAFVNRVWAEYFGSGIINPPDDMNLANPPSNAPLLDYLAEGFIAHNFDMQWLHREIVTSQAYQRSALANPTNRLDERNFSRALVRRLPAEVLLDAIAQATAGSAELSRVAVAVLDRAIGPKGGAFVGRRGEGDYASKVFGRSPRDANCDCSASTEPNLLQAIFLQNDQEVSTSIDRTGGWLGEVRPVVSQAASREPIIVEAFLRTLSRRPARAEAERALAYFAQAGDPGEGLRDLLWALLNTREFITNH